MGGSWGQLKTGMAPSQLLGWTPPAPLGAPGRGGGSACFRPEEKPRPRQQVLTEVDWAEASGGEVRAPGGCTAGPGRTIAQ